MSEDINSGSRRKILKTIAATGATGAGLGTTSGSAGATSSRAELADTTFDFSRGKQPLLESKGVLPDASQLDVPSSVRNGQRLLGELATDGHLKRPSFELLPEKMLSSEGEEGAYEMLSDGHIEVGFVVNTDNGKLQITFSEVSPPFAVIRNEDAVIEYSLAEDNEYRRVDVSAKEGVSTTDVTTSGCTDCSGCWCRWALCYFNFELIRCYSCYDGTCLTTDKCGC